MNLNEEYAYLFLLWAEGEGVLDSFLDFLKTYECEWPLEKFYYTLNIFFLRHWTVDKVRGKHSDWCQLLNEWEKAVGHIDF